MSEPSSKREALAGAATDYVLERGLIGLSLRPLAAAVGTSDRMLLYHFAGKDDLVATVLRLSNDRAVAVVTGLEPVAGPREAVLRLWSAVSSPGLDRCQRVYVEAAALGLFGREPYAAVVREANAVWVEAVAGYLVACGVPAGTAPRAVALLDAAVTGFLLDLPLDEGDPAQRQAVEDLATAVAAIAAAAQGSA